MKGYIVSAVLIAIAAAFAGGWYQGRRQANLAVEAARAAVMEQAIRNADLASRKEAERLAMEAERDALAQTLEDQAYADADASGGLSRARVDRLRKR